MIQFDNILNELKFETSRSGGKGGQGVNKIESKVCLVWKFTESLYLTQPQIERITKNGKAYVVNDFVRITSQDSRSQLDNKKQSISKLRLLLKEWLKVNKVRRKTKTPKSVIAKRLNNKKRNSDLKKSRAKPKQ